MFFREDFQPQISQIYTDSDSQKICVNLRNLWMYLLWLRPRRAVKICGLHPFGCGFAACVSAVLFPKILHVCVHVSGVRRNLVFVQLRCLCGLGASPSLRFLPDASTATRRSQKIWFRLRCPKSLRFILSVVEDFLLRPIYKISKKLN